MKNISKVLAISVILLTIVLSGCSSGSPFATETPPPPTSTNTPEPTTTLTPTPTNTPVPPTPTVTPPSILSEYLDNVVVTNMDDFSSKRGWDLWAGKIFDGMLQIEGKDWNGLGKKGVYPEGKGIVINFKYERGSEFEVYYDYGDWQTDAYRRFGIYLWSEYPKANLWLGKRGLGFNNLQGNLNTNPDTWYSLLMATSTDGEFLAVIWNPEKPGRVISYHEKNDKWAGYAWNLRIGANQGVVVFDDFMEIEFSGIK